MFDNLKPLGLYIYFYTYLLKCLEKRHICEMLESQKIIMSFSSSDFSNTVSFSSIIYTSNLRSYQKTNNLWSSLPQRDINCHRILGQNIYPYPLDGTNRSIGGVLIGKYWSVNMVKPGLEVPLQLYTKYILFQIGGSLECSLRLISETKARWSLIQIIGGLQNTNLVVVTNIIIIWNNQIDF